MATASSTPTTVTVSASVSRSTTTNTASPQSVVDTKEVNARAWEVAGDGREVVKRVSIPTSHHVDDAEGRKQRVVRQGSSPTLGLSSARMSSPSPSMLSSVTSPDTLPPEVERVQASAKACYAQGDYFQALDCYTDAIKLCPDTLATQLAVFHCNRALCYLQINQFQAAEHDCTQALKLKPRYVRALCRRAQSLEEQQRFDEAVGDLHSALEHCDGDAVTAIRRALARVKHKQGLVEQARSASAQAKRPPSSISSASWSVVDVGGDGPLPRWEHSAVLLGSTLYVFGGTDNVTDFEDFWKLDLDGAGAGTWSRIYSPCTAADRCGHSCVVYNNEIYVFGGTRAFFLNDMHKYTPATHRWTEVKAWGSLPPPRHDHTAVVYGHLMYVFGGEAYLGVETLMNDVYEYNFLNNMWRKVSIPREGKRPTGRMAHTAVVDGDYMYVFGGLDSTGYLDDFYAFSLTNFSWARVCPPKNCETPPSRAEHSAVALNGCMYVFGGYHITHTGPEYHADLYEFEFRNMTWAKLSPGDSQLPGRAGHTLIGDGSSLMLFGGCQLDGMMSSVHRYRLPLSSLINGNARVAAPLASNGPVKRECCCLPQWMQLGVCSSDVPKGFS